MDISSAAIATVIATLSSLLMTQRVTKSQKIQYLDDQLDRILQISVQYPYLESKDYTSAWTSSYDRNDEKALRYETYCTMVFNYMSRLAKLYKYDELKISEHVAIKPWARIHAKYWRNPTVAYENVDTYDRAFVDLIESYVKGC